MNEIVTVSQDASSLPTIRREREYRVVSDPVPILDTARFEHMLRIATAIAKSNMVPFTLCRWKDDAGNDKWLDLDTVVSNCFLVVNQAVRWGMDPFAVISCASLVHGKLTFEGKLIAAVLEAKLGVELDPVWNDKMGDEFGITIGGKLPSGKYREIRGTVGEWKTTGKNSPWGNPRRQLLYRGTREWARWWAPGLMLGVYSDDELMDLQDSARAQRVLAAPSHQEHIRQIETDRAAALTERVASKPEDGGPKSASASASTATVEQSATKIPLKSPLRPPSAPSAPSAPITAAEAKPSASAPEPKQEVVGKSGWALELESYGDRIASCEALETLVETIESYGGVFDDAPDAVATQARLIENEKRDALQ